MVMGGPLLKGSARSQGPEQVRARVTSHFRLCENRKCECWVSHCWTEVRRRQQTLLMGLTCSVEEPRAGALPHVVRATQREADSLNLMVITETLWEDTASTALSHLQGSCHLRAGVSMVPCAAHRGLGHLQHVLWGRGWEVAVCPGDVLSRAGPACSCLLPLLSHVWDCVSAGSRVRMVHFEVCPKCSSTWWMFQGTEGGLLGGSPSEFTKIPLPAVSLGVHHNSQHCPGPRWCLLHLNPSQE